jgi:hypothetical protein
MMSPCGFPELIERFTAKIKKILDIGGMFSSPVRPIL